MSDSSGFRLLLTSSILDPCDIQIHLDYRGFDVPAVQLHTGLLGHSSATGIPLQGLAPQ